MAVVLGDKEWVVWCEPMNRAKARVIASDIPKAIGWFKEKTGQEATRICLNPKLANLPIPEGIEVEYVGGCLGWEIWLSVGKNFVCNTPTARQVINKSLETPETPLETPVAITGAVTQGYPIVFTPQDMLQQKIEVLAGQGMSTRAIAGLLQAEGIEVSHMTVARRLQGKLTNLD